jgi:hypothetical protein
MLAPAILATNDTRCPQCGRVPEVFRSWRNGAPAGFLVACRCQPVFGRPVYESIEVAEEAWRKDVGLA